MPRKSTVYPLMSTSISYWRSWRREAVGAAWAPHHSNAALRGHTFKQNRVSEVLLVDSGH